MIYFLEQPRRGKSSVEQITVHKSTVRIWMQRVLTVMVICVCVCMSQAQNVYVSASATDDSGAGTTWETAKRTIAAGIATVGANGTVFVKAGGYDIDAELSVPSGVVVMGGYNPASAGTDTSQRHFPGANLHWNDNTWCTIITGSGTHRVATVQGELDGCVLKHGFTSSFGGGVLVNGGTVRYCVIKECDAYNEDPYGTPAEGGGAYVQNGGTLINCVVTECRGDKGAGAAGGNGSLISNTITRNRPIDCGVVADYDGNLYKTVVIGDQCWMRENLRTTHYADGTLIEEGNTYSTSMPCRFRGYVSEVEHQNDPSIFIRCGYLYNWPAVMHGAFGSSTNPSGIQGICPNGWHVPSSAEWSQLATFLHSVPRYWCGGNSDYYVKSLAAKEMWGVTDQYCWLGWQMGTNNRTLFTAYPVGYTNGTNYYDWGQYSVFWTASRQYGDGNPAYRYIPNTTYQGLAEYYRGMGDGCSVRCVKDN